MEDSILISFFKVSIRPLVLDPFNGDERGDDPVFNEDPRDNLSVPDLSDPPVSPEKKLLRPDPLPIDDKLEDFDAAKALSRTNCRCWMTVLGNGGYIDLNKWAFRTKKYLKEN